MTSMVVALKDQFFPVVLAPFLERVDERPLLQEGKFTNR